ncbi:MAG: hypothetical protein EOO26_09385 [Comamonadaceae bacterium]|nr:MAG: hypothetical protein EOO26_09385 [Comamonadaceae bacterium]
MNTHWIRPSLVVSALALCSALAAAQTTLIPPTIRMAPQGVEYMSGGAAKDEAAFLRMVSPRWGATLEFTLNDKSRAGLPAAARVTVRNPYNGDVVLDVPSSGPLMLARLEPGSYEVDVTLDGLTLTQPLTVLLDRPAHAVFRWPSNVDMASIAPKAPEHTTAMLAPRE